MELFYCNVFFSQLVSHNQELMRANLNSQEINEVCVCECVHLCAFVHTYMCTCMRECVCVHACVHGSVCVCTSMHACVCV